MFYMFRGLNYSLISVVQLIEENACDLTFTIELCVIQDLISRSPIRVVSLEGGLLFEEFFADKHSS